jgi:hypothetical protein
LLSQMADAAGLSDEAQSEEAPEPGMSEDEFQGALAVAIADAEEYIDGHIGPMRAEATSYYRGAPFGNEQEGRSSVVMTEVRDAVLGVMPSLLRIFVGGEHAVEFVPQNAESVDIAQQQTDYVNYVFMNDNPGFLILHSMIKDGLTRKTGIVKWRWSTDTTITEERYTGLRAEQVAIMQSDSSVEIVELVENAPKPIQNPTSPMDQAIQSGMTRAAPAGMQLAQPGGQLALQPTPPVQPPTYDVRIRRKIPKNRLVVEAIPPEEWLCDRDARDPNDEKGYRFQAHRSVKTVSDIIAMGYDRDEIEQYSTSDEQLRTNIESLARNPAGVGLMPLDTPDASQRECLFYEAYIRVDRDGLRSGMTGTPFALTPGEIGDAMGTAYQGARQAAKNRVSGLYDRAFNPDELAANGIADHVPIETVYGLANNIEHAFTYPEHGSPLIPTKENAPNTTAAIDRLRQFSDTGGFPSAFNKFSKPGPNGTPVGVSWQGIDTMRRTLDGLRKASVSNPYDAMAMRRLMDVFDSEIGKTNPLLNDARAAHAERMSTFEPQRTNAQGVNPVLSAISNDANPGNLIYNKLFGNNSISNGTAGPILDQLGSIMMSDPRAMSALREGMLNRVFQNEKTGAAHSPKIAANNIRDALNGQGAGIYQSVFDPVQLAKLQRYGDLLDHIGTTRPAINASKTSYNVTPGVRNGAAGVAGAFLGEGIGHTSGIPYAGPVMGYAGMKLGSAVDNAANNVLAHARAQRAVSGNYTPSSVPPQVAGNVASAITALNAASPAARRIGLLALLSQQR